MSKYFIASYFFLTSLAYAGPLTGSFIDIADASFNDKAEISNAVGTFKAMGMTTLVIAATAQKVAKAGCGLNAFEPSFLIPPPTVPPTPPSVLACLPDSKDPVCQARWEGMYGLVGEFLRLAQGKGMKVVVGLALSMVECGAFDSDMTHRYQTSYLNWYLTSQFETRFRSKYPDALAGYYIPDESENALPRFQSYIATQVTAIRYASSAKIYHSPYLGNASLYGYDPEVVGRWAKEFLDATHVDVLLYQDSVGAFMANMGQHPGEHTVEEYMTALARWVGKERIFADIELFSYGAPTPASLVRVNQQLWQSRMTGGLIGYIAQGQMYPKSIFDAHPGAPRLYDEYRAEYEKIGKRHGFEYTILAGQALSSNPDDKKKLRDMLAGSGRNLSDPQWVGFQGDVWLELNLGATAKMVDRVSIHCVSRAGKKMAIPSSANVALSADGVKWIDVPSLVPEAAALTKDSEYSLANVLPFGKNARFIRIYVHNGAMKTMMSEISVTANH